MSATCFRMRREKVEGEEGQKPPAAIHPSGSGQKHGQPGELSALCRGTGYRCLAREGETGEESPVGAVTPSAGRRVLERPCMHTPTSRP